MVMNQADVGDHSSGAIPEYFSAIPWHSLQTTYNFDIIYEVDLGIFVIVVNFFYIFSFLYNCNNLFFVNIKHFLIIHIIFFSDNYH